MKTSIKESLKTLGLPTCVINISGKDHTFIVDTGSSDNFIIPRVFESINEHDKAVTAEGSYYGADGNPQGIKYADIIYSVCNDNFIGNFGVLDTNLALDNLERDNNLKISGMLGLSFLIMHKCNIDYNNRTLSVKGVPLWAKVRYYSKMLYNKFIKRYAGK